MKPLLLDLYCGAGGLAVGYERAGFEVVGYDINPQPNYPFEFHQGDALKCLESLLWGRRRSMTGKWVAIHASPPCQAHTAMKHMPDAKAHIDFIPPTRKLLKQIGLPYVIENVVGAPLENPVTLCGSMFKLGAAGFQLRRHRLFESSIDLDDPPPCDHQQPTIGIYGGHVRCRSTKFWRDGGADFPGYDKKRLAMEAMDIAHPMTMNEISEAVPPAYSEWVGKQLMKVIE